MALAKKYMLAAKQDDPSLPISADGKWTGGDKILTIATNADPGKKTAEVFQGQIENLGFKLNFRIVPQDTLYTKFCGVRKEEVPICPNVAGSPVPPCAWSARAGGNPHAAAAAIDSSAAMSVLARTVMIGLPEKEHREIAPALTNFRVDYSVPEISVEGKLPTGDASGCPTLWS
jgi:hypothetical protein